jgi:hypothetical protein
MDRVEFFLDGEPIGTSTVAPYSIRWTIVMSDTKPVQGRTITAMRPITMPDGTVQMGETVVVTTEQETLPDGSLRLIEKWESGRTFIYDTHGYTETRVIQIKAYDSAGNMTETAPVTVLVTHKPKEEPTAAWLPALAPGPWPDHRLPGRQARDSLGMTQGELFLGESDKVFFDVRT